MTSRRKFAMWFVVLAMCVAARGEVLDRTIAVVNNHMITWSDLDEQMRFEALENNRALKNLDDADRRTAFEHLVQYQILRDQMQGTAPATAEEVNARIAEVRSGWHMEAGAQNDAKWAETLHHYGVSEKQLRELVTNQVEILKFMEFRVRPLVRASRREVEEYYHKVLVPQVMAQGQSPEPLEQVTPRIRELLVEQKMNREIEKWLETLRKQSVVHVLWDGVR